MLIRRTTRGQVLPLWVMAILAMFAVLFFIIDTADSLQWQIRAQNAADAAASAAVSVQAQRLNEVGAELYALSLEEYRMKRLTDGLEVVVNGDGGCADAGNPLWNAGITCASVYASLRDAFAKSLNRYTDGVQQFAQLSSALTFANEENDMRVLVATLAAPGHCGTINGGDCAFAYTIYQGGIYSAYGFHFVTMDSNNIRRSNCCDGENVNLSPMGAEVVVCHAYKPIVANFFGFGAAQRRAIARGSFVDGVVTSEWFQPGYLTNNITGKPFQPSEMYSPMQSLDGAENRYDWYDIAFGSSGWTADTTNHTYVRNGTISLGETDRYVQWWAPVLAPPVLSNAINAGTPVPCD